MFLELAMDPVEARMLDMLDSESIIALLAISGGILIAIVAIIFGTVKAMVTSRNREATKRELAAYVAEGTLDPDKAVAILESDKPRWEKSKNT